MLDYKLVEAFATVIDAGGFEKASKILGITQSAVSQRVRQLEEQYGSLLLQRTTPPRSTELGTRMLSHYARVKQLEDDLLPESEVALSTHTTLSLGVNADSLATWFTSAVSDIIKEENIILDIHVDDQDKTQELMKKGVVWGCISTKKTPLQGCKATHLGCMKYSAYAERSFAKRYFPQGLSYEKCKVVPTARFNRKDDLNKRLFRVAFNRDDLNPPYFYIPSTEQYADFILAGHCYGIMPEMQVSHLRANDQLINLFPKRAIYVHLYWHCWTLKSGRMKSFDKRFSENAHRLLAGV